MQYDFLQTYDKERKYDIYNQKQKKNIRYIYSVWHIFFKAKNCWVELFRICLRNEANGKMVKWSYSLIYIVFQK